MRPSYKGWCPYTKREIKIQGHTEGRQPCESGSRGECCYHKTRKAKDFWKPPEALRGKEAFFPRDFQREHGHIDTLISHLYPPEM